MFILGVGGAVMIPLFSHTGVSVRNAQLDHQIVEQDPNPLRTHSAQLSSYFEVAIIRRLSGVSTDVRLKKYRTL